MRTPAAGNWLILNQGSPEKCIVMGSGTRQLEKLLHVPNVVQDNIKVIRRYTGGGTVIVDHDTVFVSFIGCNTLLSQFRNKQDNFRAFPRDIMLWTEIFYHHVFQHLSEEHKHLQPLTQNFSLRENDYVFGERKFGGNAQYITGGQAQRWVHHTSFLWDFQDHNMSKYLTLPEKRPEYRSSRQHSDFLIRMKDLLTIPDAHSGTFLHAV